MCRVGSGQILGQATLALAAAMGTHASAVGKTDATSGGRRVVTTWVVRTCGRRRGYRVCVQCCCYMRRNPWRKVRRTCRHRGAGARREWSEAAERGRAERQRRPQTIASHLPARRTASQACAGRAPSRAERARTLLTWRQRLETLNGSLSKD